MSNGVWLRGAVVRVIAAAGFLAVSLAAESAELTLSRMVWDFESVQQGDTAAQKIVLKNTGADVAKVHKVELPAGFSVNPELAAKEIPAGGEFEVEFTFDSSGILGKLQQYAYIFLSGGEILPLTIKGEVYEKAEPRLEVTPTEWDFGTVTVGESRQMSFRCKNTGTADLELDEVQVYDPRFEVTRNIPKEKLKLPPGDQVDFIVSVNPKYPGKCDTDFYVKSNSAGSKYTKISAKGNGIAKTPGVVVSSDLSSVTNNTAFRLEVTWTDNLGREQILTVNRDSQSSFTPEPGTDRPNPENYTLTIKLARAVTPTPPPEGVQPSAVIQPEGKPAEGEDAEKPAAVPEGEPARPEEVQPPVEPEPEPTPEPQPPKEEAAPPVEKPEETKPETPTEPDEKKPSQPEGEPTDKPSSGETEGGEPTVKPEEQKEAKPTLPETEKDPAEPEKEESPEPPTTPAPENPAPEPPAKKPAESPGSTNK